MPPVLIAEEQEDPQSLLRRDEESVVPVFAILATVLIAEGRFWPVAILRRYEEAADLGDALAEEVDSALAEEGGQLLAEQQNYFRGGNRERTD